MDLFEAVSARASYRGAYESTPIPREDLQKILQAGAAAPSGCNAQTASFVAVDDRPTLDRLAAVLQKPTHATAPAAICVFTKPVPVYGGAVYNVQDYAAAIENMLLAITALGYASCWVEGYVTSGDVGSRMAKILDAPEDMRMVCFLPVGVPQKKPVSPEKQPIGQRAFWNEWGKCE